MLFGIAESPVAFGGMPFAADCGNSRHRGYLFLPRISPGDMPNGFERFVGRQQRLAHDLHPFGVYKLRGRFAETALREPAQMRAGITRGGCQGSHPVGDVLRSAGFPQSLVQKLRKGIACRRRGVGGEHEQAAEQKIQADPAFRIG